MAKAVYPSSYPSWTFPDEKNKAEETNEINTTMKDERVVQGFTPVSTSANNRSTRAESVSWTRRNELHGSLHTLPSPPWQAEDLDLAQWPSDFDNFTLFANDELFEGDFGLFTPEATPTEGPAPLNLTHDWVSISHRGVAQTGESVPKVDQAFGEQLNIGAANSSDRYEYEPLSHPWWLEKAYEKNQTTPAWADCSMGFNKNEILKTEADLLGLSHNATDGVELTMKDQLDPCLAGSSTYLGLELTESGWGTFDTELDVQGENGIFDSATPSVAVVTAFRSTSQNEMPTCRTNHSKNAQRDATRDLYLVQCKDKGMSYKEIKALGGFDEAESTLRGRYRTLTKPKDQRVRKPEWREQDLRLLVEGVSHLASDHGRLQGSWSGGPTSEHQDKAARIPWKLVAEYMANRGAYKFGNATVKKKYFEMMRAGRRW